ncbi:MAG: phage portal protein [Methanocorpusculum sp.]|nr:phage portal protein [Methanocorpusculum sp.]
MGVTNTFFGRRVIMSDATEITDATVLDVLGKAILKHNFNRNEIQYLWDYYRGNQPVLQRTKTVRPEICNRIVENRANEIVSFKVGYLCGEPIQYVGHGGDETVGKSITELNELMLSENKATQDKEIVEWQMICGTAFRLVLPSDSNDEDSAPFEIYTLDPRDSFVVYSSEIGHKPLMGVKFYLQDDGICRTYSVYTKNHYWKIEDTKIVESKPHALGMIPIFEYPANNARLGSFEIVLPMLDAINDVASNRMDGLEQFIQAFIKFVNCDITVDDFKELKDLGAIKVKSVDGQTADVDIVTNELNQDQTQTMVDYMYQTVLTICGMPNRNGGSSTSDTGSAVVLRDGWSLAEARAKDSELMFKRSEQEMLKLVLKICRELDSVNLRVRDVQLQFTRRNYENIQNKAQVLTSLLRESKVHPLLAFQHSGLFVDPESAYQISMSYYEEEQKKLMEQQEKQIAASKVQGNPTE